MVGSKPLVNVVRDAIGNTQLMVPGDLRSLLCASTYANDHVVALLLRDAARMAINAILDAIAEPTEAIILASDVYQGRDFVTIRQWRAMIAALRKEIDNADH